MAVANELITKFTFKGNLKPIKEFQTDLKQSIITIGKYGAALGAVTVATAAWANSTLRGAESLVRLQKDTDLSIQQLQQLQFITAQNGVTAEEFENQILSLSEKIGEAATQGSDDFNRLGVSVRDANGNIRNTGDIIRSITQRFKTLSQAQRISFARKLGIDQKLISSFDKTDKQLEELIKRSKQFGLVTDKQTKQLDKYFASIETLRFGFTAVSRQIALQFAPVLEKLSKTITDFLADYGSIFGKVFAEFFDGIGNLISAFDSLIENTLGWKVTLVGLGAAALVAFPAAAIVAGITLILVVIEDLITAFKGGESVIQNIAVFTKDLVLSVINDFIDLDEWIDTITSKFKNLLDFIKSVGSSAGKFFGGIGETLGFTDSPLTNSSIANTTSNTQTNTINIDVNSNDPFATGEAINNSLVRQLEQGDFQFGKGGR